MTREWTRVPEGPWTAMIWDMHPHAGGGWVFWALCPDCAPDVSELDVGPEYWLDDRHEPDIGDTCEDCGLRIVDAADPEYGDADEAWL